METLNLILIGIVAISISILIGTTIGIVTDTTEYERIEIVPNGTSIEIPDSQEASVGEEVKFWNWSDGALITYNSLEDSNATEISSALGFYEIKELFKQGSSENINGTTVHTLDGAKLINHINVKGDGTYYCVYLINGTTKDNIIICCSDEDVLMHMVNSVQYKKNSTVTEAEITDNVTVNETETITANVTSNDSVNWV